MSRVFSVLVLAVLLASLVAASPASGGSPPPVVSAIHTLTAPDAGATNFGNSSSPFASVPRVAAMDAFRAVVPADLDGGRVAYVFTRNPTTGQWFSTATIDAPAGASSRWAYSVSVHGPKIAIADPDHWNGDENYGRVHVYDFDSNNNWVETQTITEPGRFVSFAADVWLGSDALIVRESIICDADCSAGYWYRYERNGGTDFVKTDTDIGVDNNMVVGADRGRMIVGVPGTGGITSCDPFDSELEVFDTANNPASVLLGVTEPNLNFCGGLEPYFRQVDIHGDVVVWESCCNGAAELEIRRFDGTAYQSEQVVPVGEASDGLAAIPNAILRADIDSATFSSLVFTGTNWIAGADVPMPADVVSFSPVLAAQNRVAVLGVESLHVMNIDTPVSCGGRLVTVDIGQGDDPTDGDDVIFGTPFADVIDADEGNDVVCGFAGDDDIVGGDGGDLILAGEGNDTVDGGDGADIIGGGDGNDELRGGGDGDLIVGQAGDDDLFGDGGDDLIGGSEGADNIDGGLGGDLCHGGTDSDPDTAVDCEIVGAVP